MTNGEAVIAQLHTEIASLRAQLEGCKEMFAHTAERANEYVKAFQQQEGKLESARKAAIEECAKVATDRASIEADVIRIAERDTALSVTGRQAVQEHASTRQVMATQIARTILALTDEK